MRYILGFSRKLHLVGRGIMFFTKSDVSHVYVRQEGENKAVDYVLEAVHPTVNMQWHELFKRKKAIVAYEFEVDFPQDNLDYAWRKACYERLELKYGWASIFGYAYVYIRRWLTGKWVANPFPGPQQDVCTETALYWLRTAGVHGFKEGEYDPNVLSGSDGHPDNKGILEVVREHPAVFKELPLEHLEDS